MPVVLACPCFTNHPKFSASYSLCLRMMLWKVVIHQGDVQKLPPAPSVWFYRGGWICEHSSSSAPELSVTQKPTKLL